jgi:uncharacterized protein (DUF169 family)
MTNQEIEEKIRKHTPEIKKDFVAIKIWKEEPKDVPKYEGPVFPGICTQIGEVLAAGKNSYTTKDQSFCQAANMSVGVRPPLTDEEWTKTHEGHQQISKDCKDIETARKYYQIEEIKLCPLPKEKNIAVQAGLFKDVKDPDIVLIFCNPLAGDIINRAYAYSLGEIIKGFGSHGGCRFVLGYPHVMKEPCLTIGDPEWRGFIGMEDDEITLAFPYQSLLRFIDNFDEPAEYYRKYYKMIKFLVRNNPKSPPTPELMSQYHYSMR